MPLILRTNLLSKPNGNAVAIIALSTHDEPVPTNTMVTRSTPAIVLGPTGNLQGTYKFFSLETGKNLKHRKLTAYTMPD